METARTSPSTLIPAASTSLVVSIFGAMPAAALPHSLDCKRRTLHAPAAQPTRRPDPEDVFAEENDDFVWIDLDRMLAGREAARRLHPSFRG